MSKKLVMVEVLSQFRLRYAIEVENDIDHALDEVIMRTGDFDFKEFSQKHLDPPVLIDHYEITSDEYLKMFDEDNDYLASWDEEKKLSMINTIDYSDEREYDDGA
jgi:hypothetical protein